MHFCMQINMHTPIPFLHIATCTNVTARVLAIQSENEWCYNGCFKDYNVVCIATGKMSMAVHNSYCVINASVICCTYKMVFYTVIYTQELLARRSQQKISSDNEDKQKEVEEALKLKEV